MPQKHSLQFRGGVRSGGVVGVVEGIMGVGVGEGFCVVVVVVVVVVLVVEANVGAGEEEVAAVTSGCTVLFSGNIVLEVCAVGTAGVVLVAGPVNTAVKFDRFGLCGSSERTHCTKVFCDCLKVCSCSSLMGVDL